MLINFFIERINSKDYLNSKTEYRIKEDKEKVFDEDLIETYQEYSNLFTNLYKQI